MFILAFKKIDTGEILYFYCTWFQNKNNKWVVAFENSSISLPHNRVELIGSFTEIVVNSRKDKIYYPFEFNVELL